jgi:hypothetical protein
MAGRRLRPVSDLDGIKIWGGSMEEQRIKTLEEEFKVLKNQIKAVLLDIKEQLATGGGDGHSVAAQMGNVSTAIPQAENNVKVFPEPPASEPEFKERGAGTGIAEKAEPDFGAVINRSGMPVIAGGSPANERVDLLTVSVLSQWLSRATASVSKAQVCKLVEIYDITGNLPPRLKQVILLLADLYGNGSHTEEDENLPATTSIQLLIELDSLLRYRTGALESVVLSILLDKGPKNRRSG